MTVDDELDVTEHHADDHHDILNNQHRDVKKHGVIVHFDLVKGFCRFCDLVDGPALNKCGGDVHGEPGVSGNG